MPVGRRFDFQIAGKGFLLARGEYRGRAWQRTGRSDAPGQRSQADARYGVLPDEIDRPEVWDDWSGGFGRPYRKTGENTYHWSENFDARSPRQLVHCQNVYLAKTTFSAGTASAAWLENCDGIADVTELANTNPGTIGLFSKGGMVVAYPHANGLGFRVLASVTYSANTVRSIDKPAMYGGYMYWGLSAATVFLQMSTNYSYQYGLNSGYRFEPVGDRLWRAHGNANAPYFVQNVANPAGVITMSNWSATIAIGNQMADIRDLTSVEDQLFAGTAQGLFAGDSSGTFVNVLSELANQYHPDNCRNLTVYRGAVVAPHIAGVFAYQPQGYGATVLDISPPRSERSPIKGMVRAVRSYGQWLYAGLYTGSRSYLLSGQQAGDRFIWHPLQRLPHVMMVNRLHVDGIRTASGGTPLPNRFWLLGDQDVDATATAPVYWWPIPELDGNPLAPSYAFSPNYIGSARIDLGRVDWDAPGTPKVYRDVEVWADNLASGAQWANLYYTVDQEATRHLLGTTAKSPKDTIYFPAGEGSFITGQSIELSLESFTASAAITPVYRSLVLRGALQPRSNDLITAVVRIADELRDRQGSVMRSGATMLKELRDFGNPDVDGAPHQLIDLAGATQWVRVLGRVEETEVYQQGDENPEVAAKVQLAVLSYSGG